MILIVDNYDSFTYNLYQAIAVHSDAKVVRNDKITLAEIQQLKPKGIILSPGPGRPENAGICVELIKKCYQTIPILGVCLGHQAIAYAFGGKIIPAEKIIHGKKDIIFHYRKQLYRRLPLPFTAGRYHSLMVEKHSLPKEFIIEAENAQQLIMGLKHKDYSLFGVQFHPESILTEQGNLFLQEFIALCH